MEPSRAMLDSQAAQREVAGVVVARGLTKQYTTGDGICGLNLTVPRGCKFGLLGPNGAGKSTTLKLMMGMLVQDSGELSVLGCTSPVQFPSLRARIGYVPERHYMYRWMTVGEIIRFTRAFYPTWDNARCDALLRQYGLTLDKRVDQLSHGMQTKLALTLALAHEPELLILDEPTTGLDPIVREEFLHGILDTLVADIECTVVLSSHIMSDVESVCDMIAIINEGQLLLCASRQELMAETKRLVVTLDDPATEVPRLEGVVLVHRHADHVTFTVHGDTTQHVDRLRAQPGVHSVDVHDMSLEDVFKDLVKGARATP